MSLCHRIIVTVSRYQNNIIVTLNNKIIISVSVCHCHLFVGVSVSFHCAMSVSVGHFCVTVSAASGGV